MATIKERYEHLLAKGDLEAPPPEGVECDCDSDDEHFHVRCMAASCDECGQELGPFDFFVYTKAEGFHALAEKARELGWTVDEQINHYACAACSAADLGQREAEAQGLIF